jgi:hypothetical protein
MSSFITSGKAPVERIFSNFRIYSPSEVPRDFSKGCVPPQEESATFWKLIVSEMFVVKYCQRLFTTRERSLKRGKK